jgi:hypothetical protein
MAAAGTSVTVVVPTRNSARWIAHIHQYYLKIGVAPLYCVDARSSDDTASILSRLGARTETIVADANHVEALLPLISEVVETPWILRIDDDECPSRNLIRWVRRGGFSGQVGIRRLWLRFMPARRQWWWPSRESKYLEFAARDGWNWELSRNGEDRQFRLYRKDKVRYYPAIHTAGFRLRKPMFAPRNCVIYHFDWILRTLSEREAKVANYGSHSDFYLPERIQDWEYRGTILDRSVRSLARQMLNNG